ncbi:hypothetical protein [Parabacteroides distasonis]|uniref:hypothetical protein n=1 Tax=Parabacteroides distasonis TaxID=823 RepID=UPI0018A958AC|nr:hypothetical protein [Parabacteroides distasonis]MDB9024791.1 hypothetical protein [Parabacteroides distasonis]MDB9041292.1 hypothetical protein [Parabacteroides distasonis]MDB9093414.1 hypothetical protein [Parabacteroides distasonis]MDB9162790.1 hypothetical protein [Parabacteroides distasonis]
MKQLRLPFLLLFLSLILLGCENKIDIERNSSATPFKVNQETGYVMYREEIKDWCISLNIPDNIDSYVYFYDKDMKDSFKKEGLLVKFSGEAVESTFQPAIAMCCVEYYCLTITQIEEIR